MSMYIEPNPVAKPILISIRQAIKEERANLDDVEWDTGKRPNPWYLNFLLNEQKRGITEVFKDWE